MMLGQKREGPLSKPGVQLRCDVAGHLRERVQTGAGHSAGGRLHNIGQITWRLSYLNVVHQGAKFVKTLYRYTAV